MPSPRDDSGFFLLLWYSSFRHGAQNNIMLNGIPYELTEPCSVSRLLELLNMKGKPVVVEHNGAALLPQDFSRVTVSPGDRVEIVSIVAGG